MVKIANFNDDNPSICLKIKDFCPKRLLFCLQCAWHIIIQSSFHLLLKHCTRVLETRWIAFISILPTSYLFFFTLSSTKSYHCEWCLDFLLCLFQNQTFNDITNGLSMDKYHYKVVTVNIQYHFNKRYSIKLDNHFTLQCFLLPFEASTLRSTER